jgi:hypothetical protein
VNTFTGFAGCSWRFCLARAAASPSPWAEAAPTETIETSANAGMPSLFMATLLSEDYSLRSDAAGSTAAARRAGR